MMLLGDSSGAKYEPFLVFKTRRSSSPDTQQENNRVRHGFGRTLWREIEQLQDGMQIYGNEKGA